MWIVTEIDIKFFLKVIHSDLKGKQKKEEK